MADLIGDSMRLGQIGIDLLTGTVHCVGWRRNGAAWDCRYQCADVDDATDLQQKQLDGVATEVEVENSAITNFLLADDGLGAGFAHLPDGSLLFVYGDGWVAPLTVNTGDQARLATVHHRTWSEVVSGPTVESIQDDAWCAVAMGTPEWSGTYVANGTYGGYTSYQQIGGGRWLLWATWLTYSGWVLVPTNTPTIPDDIAYASLASPGELPNDNPWDAAPGYGAAGGGCHDGLINPFLTSDSLSSWMVCGTYLYTGVRCYQRQAWGDGADDTWHITETNPFGDDLYLSWPSCAILPDGSLLVSASGASNTRITRSRDQGATWDEVTTTDMIGDGLVLGTICTDAMGSVWISGWASNEIWVRAADAETATSYDLVARVLTGSDTHIKVCDAVPDGQTGWRSQVACGPDGQILVAVERPVDTGENPTWTVDWYRLRDADTGFVQVPAP